MSDVYKRQVIPFAVLKGFQAIAGTPKNIKRLTPWWSAAGLLEGSGLRSILLAQTKSVSPNISQA